MYFFQETWIGVEGAKWSKIQWRNEYSVGRDKAWRQWRIRASEVKETRADVEWLDKKMYK